jgi:hypothetical protein
MSHHDEAKPHEGRGSRLPAYQFEPGGGGGGGNGIRLPPLPLSTEVGGGGGGGAKATRGARRAHQAPPADEDPEGDRAPRTVDYTVVNGVDMKKKGAVAVNVEFKFLNFHPQSFRFETGLERRAIQKLSVTVGGQNAHFDLGGDSRSTTIVTTMPGRSSAGADLLSIDYYVPPDVFFDDLEQDKDGWHFSYLDVYWSDFHARKFSVTSTGRPTCRSRRSSLFRWRSRRATN